MAILAQMLQRVDTAANWTTDNPVLGSGEIGFESDTNKLKIGNGSTAWVSLPYVTSSGSGAVSSVFGRTGAVVANAGDYNAAQVGAISTSLLGANSGVATLDSGGHVTSTQLPAATTVSPGTVIIDGVATDFLPIGIATAGAIGKLADAGHVHPTQPWQFMPEAYGAKGNGKVIYDATISGGSLSTLTSASANFTSADTGKIIAVDGAKGATVTALVSAITFVNSTTVTLTTPATSAVTNSYACYGTDDTAAFIACVNAMGTYGKTHNYYAEMLLKAAVYIINGPLVQGGPGLCNAQIPLPVNQASNAAPTLVLAFTGVKGGQGSSMFSGSGTIPGPDWSGTVLFSTLTGQSYSATFGAPTMIGGPTPEQGYTGAFSNLWNNLIPVVTGVTCMANVIPTLNMMDFRSCSRMHIEWMKSIVFTSFSSTAGYNSPLAQGPAGLVCPQGGNNAYSYVGSYACYGFGVGFLANESVWAGFIGTFLCDTGIYYNESSDGHGVTIGRWAAEANNTHLFTGGGATGPMPFNVLSMETENISQWTAGKFINDGGNVLGGRINISNSLGTGPSILTGNIIGASNCEIIYQGQGGKRGAQTPPTMVASGSSLQNPFWKHCWVTVSGGSGVTVSVDGQSTGLSSGAFRVPSGQTISLGTYTGSPAWNWWAD